MIYITGDLHGDIDRFKSKEMRKLKKNDTLIVCGDFGFLWDGTQKERNYLKWIGKRKYQVLFVEGTHDNRELLEEYPVEEWNGGETHLISGKLRHLCRGNIFTIEGHTIFAFGGGESEDSDSRIATNTWWSGELPTLEELREARDKLAAFSDEVDYIITHQCSRKIKELLTMENNDANVLDTFFDQVRAHCSYKQWFFGGYHINKVIPPSEMALFKAVVPITASRL